MTDAAQPQDPLEFIKSMWAGIGFPLPGIVTPTLDVGELEKRIADLKAVEGWLKMNLSMLQMSIQGLEMQRATLAALQSMSQSQSGSEPEANPFASSAFSAASWPWNFMQAQTENFMQAQPESAAPPPQKKRAAPRKKKPAA